MHRRTIYAVLVFAVAGLSACGGGSSSSGGTQGGPAPTAFAGTYQGQFSVNVQGLTDTTSAVITVSENGLVSVDTAAEEAPCVEDPTPTTPFLAGDRIGLEVSGSCFLPALGGTCQIAMQGEVRFTTTNAVGEGPFQFMCPNGNFNGTWGLGAQKVS